MSRAGDIEELSLTPSIRTFVLAAANHSCQECGVSGDEAALQIHHITPKAEGGTNHPENLTVYCEECHRQHHEDRGDWGPSDDGIRAAEKKLARRIETEGADIDPVPADHRIIAAVERIGPATTGEIADEVGVSSEYVRRRLYALGSVEIVAKSQDRNWALSGEVENPVTGKLPDNPQRAARFARDDMMRRMRETGMDHSEIAEIAGLSEQTVPTAINRARAFDPPIPSTDEDETDPEELQRQLLALLQRVDLLEKRVDDSPSIDLNRE